ncbi:hypothetical protein JW905_01110 [bacterium]|nr:hypothetical protein [candidate division CSSED10-310 bacterium]
MSKLKQFLKKLLPKDFFSEYQAVVIPSGKRMEVNKYFRAGPGRFEFEFIVRQDNVFGVKIGMAADKKGRFRGIPTDTKHIKGENQGAPFRIVLSGADFHYKSNDKWLVKARANNFDPYKKDHVLDIHVTEL